MPRGTSYLNLETINKDGSVPESRLNDPAAVQAIVQQMILANDKRSKTDALVTGLLNGNPPYRQSKLRAEAQGYRSNANFRIGEAFRNVALTSYWDSISEAPQKAQVRTAYGNADQIDEWSGVITEEFDRLNQEDTYLNYMFRLSQHDMVVFRCGPCMYEDTYGTRCRAIKQSQLLVEDGAASNVDEWVIAACRISYKADELYSFIRNPETAARIGYDVKAVRKALLDHVPSSFFSTLKRRDWEFYQQQITNNDLYISRISEEIPVAHAFYREFPKNGEARGRISHCIVLENGEPSEFLFRKVGRFAKWHNVIHPFYYDTGDGTHHSVKGLGIKAYAALELYNRLENHLVDSAFFGSSVHFQARDSADMQNLAIVPMGPFMLHPPGTDLLNVNIGGQLDGPVVVKQDLINTLTANLAQYRQDVNRRRQQGAERPTAREVNYQAENENIIGKSGMTWYFEQLDPFWQERFRRCANPNITTVNQGGKEALAFQKRCRDRGVPMEALLKIEYVRATRTIGFGSADARLQAMTRMLSRFPLYDEVGKRRILENITAADVGWSQMRSYVPKTPDSPFVAEQRAEARQWLASMKLGIMPEVTATQNPVIYAGVWLKAASDAAASLQQGANPMEVFSFLETAGPAIRQQLDRFAGDETRKEIYEKMDEQWRQLSAIHDQLGAQLQKQAQAQQKEQQRLAQMQSQSNGELAIKARESQGKLSISEQKAQKQLQLREERHRQDLALDAQRAQQDAAIADVTTATKIRNETATARSRAAKSKPE